MADQSEDLIVRFRIPVSNEGWGGPSVVFQCWLPRDEGRAVRRQKDRISARLWADEEAVKMLADKPQTDEGYSKWMDVRTYGFHVEVTLGEAVHAELARFIYDRPGAGRHVGIQAGEVNLGDVALAETYAKLAHDALAFALETYNRFIDYVRVEKAQYWLPNRPFDANQVNNTSLLFGAVARVGSLSWIQWDPPDNDVFLIELEREPFQDNPAWVHEEDWAAVGSYLSGNTRPDGARELASNALALAAMGRDRNAVVEAIAALELAVSEFTQRPRREALPNANGRIDLSRLMATSRNLGFRGTMHYLLPLILDETQLPTRLLTACQQLIDLRNNAVHNGQRNFDSREVWQLTNAARETVLGVQALTARRL